MLESNQNITTFMHHRRRAMTWWNNLSLNVQKELTKFDHKNRHPVTLTGREIQKLFDKYSDWENSKTGE